MNVDTDAATNGNADDLYEKAVAYALENQDFSCSGLQRHLRVGYFIAKQLLDRMVKKGLIPDVQLPEDPPQVICKIIGADAGRFNTLHDMFGDKGQGLGIIAVARNTEAIDPTSEEQVFATGVTDNEIAVKRSVVAEISLQSPQQIDEAIRDAHLVFIAAGRGSDRTNDFMAAAANSAKSQGIFSIALVDPSELSDSVLHRQDRDSGLHALTLDVDAVFVLPPSEIDDVPEYSSDRSKSDSDRTTRPDATLAQIYALLFPLFNIGISIGLNDFCRSMGGVHKHGPALIKSASGAGSGPNRILDASSKVLSNPSFSEHLKDADGVLITIRANQDLSGREIKQIVQDVRMQSLPTCISGCCIQFDKAMASEIEVVVFASRWGKTM